MSEPETSPPAEPGSRPALPWQAVVAATVLALTAAALVLVIGSGGGDDADPTTAPPEGMQELELTPREDVPDDPLAVEVTHPGDGTTTLAGRLDGAPMVVNFFASWCAPCVKEMPDFESASQRLGARVDFFGVAVTDRPEDAREIVDETGVSYPWARDVRGDLAGSAEVVQMPSTMFVRADGTIAEVHAGAVDEAELLGLIEEHLGVTP